MTCMANEVIPKLMRDTDSSYQKVLSGMKANRTLQRAWPTTRAFLEFIMALKN